ncbi:MAG: alpha/beta family hydrolase [Hyphomicrobium sp.]
MADFLITGPANAKATLMLAPGAGAPMTSAWMSRVAELLAGSGFCVVRFEFAYMKAHKPPQKAERLVAEYEAAVAELLDKGVGGGPLLIGGKSLGGRVASLAADALYGRGAIGGLVCLGYPFHPPGKPEQLRTQHLKTLTCPALIVQGERDPFGGVAEVAGYGLAPSITVQWATDGDHDLKPRKSSGATLDSNLAAAVEEIARFARERAQAR